MSRLAAPDLQALLYSDHGKSWLVEDQLRTAAIQFLETQRQESIDDSENLLAELSAFSAEEFDDLFIFAKTPELRPVPDQFAPGDSLSIKVRKAIIFCQRRDLIPQLRAEIKQARPGRYQGVLAELRGTADLVLSLPADLADFTGRQAQIDHVRDRLNQRGTVVINGMGGIGKTALAVHVAHQLVAEGRFPDAQLYIDLQGAGTSPVDPVDALDSLLNAILDPDPNRPRDLNTLAALWRQAIDGKDALLILDNAADAVQVRPLLPGCPTCAVLVTSRQRFTLPGARRLDLRPMRRAEARNLLQELAPHLDNDGADQIAELCGRLPQALRVAGNYLNLNDDYPPDRYAGMLADERTRLAQLRDPEDPDQDVAVAISLSVNQLDDNLRRAWALLSLFSASFDPTGAAALWSQEQPVALDGLQEEPASKLPEGMPEVTLLQPLDEEEARARLHVLRNRSLVAYDRESGRYLLHDLVRLAAAGDLESLGEEDVEAARLRLPRHYEGVARAADDLYLQGGENILRALALFDREWPHIRTGQAWAAAHASEDDEAARLSMLYPDAGFYCLSLRLHSRDWIAWLDAALRAARRLGDRRGVGQVLGNLGLAYADLGEMEKAIEHCTAALEIAREIGDRHTEGYALGNLGLAYARLGETEKAIEHHTVSLQIAREIGDRRSEGNYLGNLGLAYARLGETEKAIEHHTASLQIAREIGDRRGEGNYLGNLGSAYAAQGEADKAIEHYQQALEIAREIGDQRGQGEDLVNLGLVYRDQGDTARACDHWTQALAIFEAYQDPRAAGVRDWLTDLPQ